MMYKTHVQVSKVFYAMSVPIAVQAGLLPEVVNNFDKGIIGTISAGAIFIASLYAGYKGAIFGAGYPDLDCAGSSPDRKYPLLGKIMRMFGVTHRGKYSHSFDSLTLTFLLALLIVKFGMNGLVAGEVENSIMTLALADGGIINNLIQVWIVGAWVGAISHLFADASTKSGIRIFFFMDNFRIVPNHKFFRTGADSLWEKFFRLTFRVVTPLSVIASIYIII